MELDASERAAVAAFFAKRFPSEAERLELARRAGLSVLTTPVSSPATGWERVLVEAQRRGRLGRLARRLARSGDLYTQALAVQLDERAQTVDTQVWHRGTLAVAARCVSIHVHGAQAQ